MNDFQNFAVTESATSHATLSDTQFNDTELKIKPLSAEDAGTSDHGQDTFRISPLIRITLHNLYGSLVLPLPLLAYQVNAPVHPGILAAGVVLGWVALTAALSERVTLDAQGIQVSYAGWVPQFWRKGWSIQWQDIVALKPRSTGQGGLVYYLLNHDGTARLLPMRMAGFARFVRAVQQRTGIDTTDIRPLSQPWMYLILLTFTLFLWLIDGWMLWAVLSGSLV